MGNFTCGKKSAHFSQRMEITFLETYIFPSVKTTATLLILSWDIYQDVLSDGVIVNLL